MLGWREFTESGTPEAAAREAAGGVLGGGLRVPGMRACCTKGEPPLHIYGTLRGGACRVPALNEAKIRSLRSLLKPYPTSGKRLCTLPTR